MKGEAGKLKNRASHRVSPQCTAARRIIEIVSLPLSGTAQSFGQESTSDPAPESALAPERVLIIGASMIVVSLVYRHRQHLGPSGDCHGAGKEGDSLAQTEPEGTFFLPVDEASQLSC